MAHLLDIGSRNHAEKYGFTSRLLSTPIQSSGRSDLERDSTEMMEDMEEKRRVESRKRKLRLAADSADHGGHDSD
jgi:hypothetical protein